MRTEQDRSAREREAVMVAARTRALLAELRGRLRPGSAHRYGHQARLDRTIAVRWSIADSNRASDPRGASAWDNRIAMRGVDVGAHRAAIAAGEHRSAAAEARAAHALGQAQQQRDHAQYEHARADRAQAQAEHSREASHQRDNDWSAAVTMGAALAAAIVVSEGGAAELAPSISAIAALSHPEMQPTAIEHASADAGENVAEPIAAEKATDTKAELDGGALAGLSHPRSISEIVNEASTQKQGPAQQELEPSIEATADAGVGI